MCVFTDLAKREEAEKKIIKILPPIPFQQQNKIIQIRNLEKQKEEEDEEEEEGMASPRSKSPRPVTPKSGDKEESFWDKFGTLGRKKKIKEGCL